MAQNFETVISNRVVGGQDVQALADSIRKVGESLDTVSKKATAIDSHPGFGGFAAKVKQGISDPLGAVEGAIESASAKFGILGQVVGGTILTMGTLAAAGFSAAKSLAAYGQQMENVGLRTGLTTKEVAQFSFAAKLVDQDVSVFERAMRGLTEAMTDNTAAGAKAREALQRLGVVPRELNGELKPAGQLFTELSDALNKLPNALERNRAGMDIFKRAWIEIGPSILKLNEGVKIANEQGFFGPSKAELEKWDDYDKKVTVAEAKLDRFFRKAKQFAAEALFPDQDLVELRRQKDAAERGAPYNIPLDVLQNLPQSRNSLGYRFTPGAGAVESVIAADRSTGNSLLDSTRSGMSRTLEGIRFAAEQAKQKYEEAYRSLQTLSDVGADAAQREIDKVASLKKTYEGLNEQLKLAEKSESARLAVLEKAQALRQQGMPFYQFGEGQGAFFVTGQQITDANTKPISSAFPPSLFRDSSGRITGSPVAPITGLTAGMQPDGSFVSPDSQRATGVLGIDALNARWAGFTQKRTADEQANLSILMAESDTVSRMVELRAGPGGELAAAKLVASIREDALQKELAQTGDIAKYRRGSRQNELELTLRIAEAEKQRVDAIRNLGAGAFDAVLGGGAGIRQFGTNILLGQGRQIAGNAAAELFKNFSPFMGSGSKMFQGTIFGQDPLKTATDINTAATIANTEALRAMAMSASGGGGGLMSSAASTFSRLGFGGVSSGSGPVEYSEDGVPIGNGLPTDGHPLNAWGFGRTAAVGAAAVGSGIGIYSGIRTGGARGALTASGSALAGAGAIMALASKSLSWAGPAGMIAGTVLGMVLPGLLGDPKAQRAEALDRERAARQYSGGVGQDYTADIYGRSVEYAGGSMRPIVIYQTNQIQAIDGPSLEQHLIDNPTALSKGITAAITGGNADDVIGSIRQNL